MRGLLFALLVNLLAVIPLFGQNLNTDDASDFTPILALERFGGSLDAVTFSPDGQQVVTGGRDNAVRIWDVETGDNTAILAGHSDWISSIAYSPNGKWIASGGRDHTIWLWDTGTETSLRLTEDHQAEIKALTFTPDSAYLISGSMDGVIRIDPISNPQATQYFDNFGGAVWSLAISPDGSTLAIGSADHAIWLLGLWDSNGSWVTQLTGHHTPVTSVAWSDDGTTLISGEQNGHIRLWDVSDARQGSNSVSSVLLEGHLAPVMGVDFTAHEDIAISSALDGTIRLWDITGEIELAKELSTIHHSGAPLTNLALSPDGGISASVGTDGTLNIWSLEKPVLDKIIERQRPVVIVNSQAEINPPIPTSQQTPSTQNQPPQQPDITASAPVLPASSGPTLMIPSVGINIGITTFPLDGVSWAIDPWEKLVGHLQGTSWVTGNGNIALGGHSLYPDGRAGIFNSLYNVRSGDEIIVQDGEIVRRYLVTDIRVVPYTDVSVVYPTAHSRVTLITCDIPSFQAESGLYGERLVVIADAIN